MRLLVAGRNSEDMLEPTFNGSARKPAHGFTDAKAPKDDRPASTKS
jgi:hypothetical protein